MSDYDADRMETDRELLIGIQDSVSAAHGKLNVIQNQAETILFVLRQDPPDPPNPPDPPEPPPPDILWNINRRIGLARINTIKHAPIAFPHEWGTLPTGQLKIKSWEWFRDRPPIGKGYNAHRDRYFFPPNFPVYIYMDGFQFMRSKGYRAYPGPGGNNAWEVVPGQYCENGKRLIYSAKQYEKMQLIETPDHPVIEKRIFLLVSQCVSTIPVDVPKENREQLIFLKPN